MAAKRTVLRQVVELPVTANCCWEKEMGGDEFCKTYRVRYNKTHEMGIIKSINIGLVSKASQKDIDSVWKQFLADLAILRGPSINARGARPRIELCVACICARGLIQGRSYPAADSRVPHATRRH